MWIVVGLGNPGMRYARTRHNVGFRVIDELARRCGISFAERETCSIGKGALEGCTVTLLKPRTYMNRSGLAVGALLRRTGRLPQDIIVVHDDLDVETGRILIRRNGSSGGHKGVESIIQESGSRDILRVKVGIGRARDEAVEEYVLSSFTADEGPVIDRAVREAADAVVFVMTDGVDKAMTRYNRTRKKDGDAGPQDCVSESGCPGGRD
jgi:PTH1 family peptidyl-tRNA hydrolase